MTERWRDKKGEPGFVFHAWMRTVDDLEDQIAELVVALRVARADIWAGCDTTKSMARISAAIAKAEDQS